MAFELPYSVAKGFIKSKGYDVPADEIWLIGIRGAVPYPAVGPRSVRLVPDTLDHWNDTIGIYDPTFNAQLYIGTVDPGLYYTEYPLDKNGAAHLLGLGQKGGRPWKFRWGWHHGKFECLVQDENFTVARDQKHVGQISDTDPRETGQYGIHIHWGGKLWSVGKWSAGCQVLFGGDGDGSPWQDFFSTLKASKQLTFTYFLIDGTELARYLKLIP